MKYFVILLISTLSCVAQTAKVIALTPEESNTVKTLMEQKKHIEEQLSKTQADIAERHLWVTERDLSGNQCYTGHYVNENNPNDPKPYGVSSYGVSSYGVSGSGLAVYSSGSREGWSISGDTSTYCDDEQTKLKKQQDIKKAEQKQAEKDKKNNAWLDRHPPLYHRWDCNDGFEFSEDYKYIVPVVKQTQQYNGLWPVVTTPTINGSVLVPTW